MSIEMKLLNECDGGILCAVVKAFRSEEMNGKKANEILSNNDILVVVAVDGENPIGWVVGHRILRPIKDEMFLYEIDVSPQHRRKQVASSLIAKLQDVCHDVGIDGGMFVLTDEGNPAAMGLYKKTGGSRVLDQVMFSYKS